MPVTQRKWIKNLGMELAIYPSEGPAPQQLEGWCWICIDALVPVVGPGKPSCCNARMVKD